MTGFGIDFGTTNSIMSVAFKDGEELKTQAFFEKNLKLPHPSIIWYKGDEVTVGHEAKKHINKYLDAPGNRFISSIKTNLGVPLRYDILGVDYKPYQVAAEIFKFLKNYAIEEYKTFVTGDITECVITIPISFTGNERKALRKAANEAGLYIKTFIHEPFAAVVWYLNNILKSERDRNFLVFDWGFGKI